MKNKQFTLIELIISIVVISVLAAIVIVQIQNLKDRAVTSAVDSSRKSLQTAVDLYFLENEKYPTVNNLDITIYTPQYIDTEKLQKEGYLKSDIDKSKISEQHYWIDVFGTVWGATKPTLNNGILLNTTTENQQTFTVNVPKDYKELHIYEVSGYNMISAAEIQLSSFTADVKGTTTSNGKKVTYKMTNSYANKGSSKVIIQIDDSSKQYLVSAIDKYDLETVPVGAGYNPEGFKPIRGGEGEYEYVLESYSLREWISFMTVQETPGESKIEYQFAAKETLKGTYGEWYDDFNEVPDSYGIKVKIKMSRDSQGNKPSLYSINILYKTDEILKKNKEVSLPSFVEPETTNGTGGLTSIVKGGYSYDHEKESNLVCSRTEVPSKFDGNKGTLVYVYYLDKDKSIYDLDFSAIQNNSSFKVTGLEIKTSKLGSPYKQVDSYLDVESESCIQFLYYVEYNTIDFKSTIIYPNPPRIYTSKQGGNVDWNYINVKADNPSSKNEEEQKEGGLDVLPDKPSDGDKELKDNNWITIDDMRFLQQGDGGNTTWYSYLPDDEYIDGKTRVVYRFALGGAKGWGAELEDFPENKSSKALLVHVYLQIHKDYIDDINIPDPKVKSIKILSSAGNYDLDAIKPKLIIYPEKNNNGERETISTESEVSWKHVAVDPNDYEIINVEWAGDYSDNPTKYTKGKHIVKARVQNSEGFWSNWAEYNFTVEEEKPVASFKYKENQTYIYIRENISFDTSESRDPDGDQIVDYEWKGKKSSYTESDLGKLTVSLRVKDSEGYWSDWVEKEFSIVDKNDNLWLVNGLPAAVAGFAEAFDTSDESRIITENYNNGDIELSWREDITGKSLYVVASAFGSARLSYLSFENDKGAEIPFVRDTDTLATVIELKTKTTIKVIVPEGATKLKFKNLYSLSTVKLINEEYSHPSVSNVTTEVTPFSAVLKWENPNDMSRIYLMRNGLLEQVLKTNTVTLDLLEPNTNYEYQLITVGADFNISKPVKVSFKTEDRYLLFEGIGAAAFDGDIGTRVITNAEENITWKEDITGKQVYIYARTSASRITGELTLKDKNGNSLSYLQEGKTVSSTKFSNYGRFTITIPEGAVRMNIKNASAIHDVSIVD